MFYSRDHRQQFYTQDDVFYHVEQMAKHEIPLGVIHLDGSIWQEYGNNCRFSPERFPDAKEMIAKLKSKNIRVVVWLVPHLDSRSPEFQEAAAKGYLVRDENGNVFQWKDGRGIGDSPYMGGFIDFSNPAARDYWHSLLDRILDIGVSGIYIDGILYEQKTGPGHWSSPLAYMDTYAKDLMDYCQAKQPDFEVILKLSVRPAISEAFATKYGRLSYIGDHGSDAKSMKEAADHFLEAANVVIGPFTETPGWYGPLPNDATYARWLRWTAFQPVWVNESGVCVDPYCPGHGSEKLLQEFRYWANVHAELQPYFFALAKQAEADPSRQTRMIRAVDAKQMTYQLGPDIFVPIVWDDASATRTIRLPEGQWIDLLDNTKAPPIEGGRDYQLPKREPGREPIFIRHGATPLQVRSEASNAH